MQINNAGNDRKKLVACIKELTLWYIQEVSFSNPEYSMIWRYFPILLLVSSGIISNDHLVLHILSLIVETSTHFLSFSFSFYFFLSSGLLSHYYIIDCRNGTIFEVYQWQKTSDHWLKCLLKSQTLIKRKFIKQKCQSQLTINIQK